ncbi:predicted protein [Coccidioides posadasii str. Silveira]|uniref:Predicted protein n=2 Tax=Coccidioides posadasii TaxID=199306 RepID=E9DFF5_COCPS|nr:predicted protein [Coccidioides posadasii str. Silveira]KMM70479.1 hypothetical protein CPAG_06790 [Coccidioides posadasii RMSCC 3488]
MDVMKVVTPEVQVRSSFGMQTIASAGVVILQLPVYCWLKRGGLRARIVHGFLGTTEKEYVLKSLRILYPRVFGLIGALWHRSAVCETVIPLYSNQNNSAQR